MKKKYLLVICAAFALSIASQSVSADIVLCDDFDDNVIGTATEAGAVNGGFSIISNTTAPGGPRPSDGTATESSSNAVFASHTANNSNSGIVSTNSFSAGAATSISATWVVDSQDFAAANHNGTEFLLQSSQAFRNAGSGTQAYFQVELNRGTGLTIDSHDGTGVDTLVANGTSSAGTHDAAMGDGYSVTIDLDAIGWTVTTMGLSTDATETGLWSAGTHDFSVFQTDLYVVSTIQKRNQTGTVGVNLDSVKVSVVPEPSSLATFGLGAFGLIARRRRR